MIKILIVVEDYVRQKYYFEMRTLQKPILYNMVTKTNCELGL